MDAIESKVLEMTIAATEASGESNTVTPTEPEPQTEVRGVRGYWLGDKWVEETEAPKPEPKPASKPKAGRKSSGVDDMIVAVLRHLGAVDKSTAVQNATIRASLEELFEYHTSAVHSVMMKLASRGVTQYDRRGTTNYHWVK